MVLTHFDIVRNMAQEGALMKPTPMQARLADIFLAPIREELLSDITQIRREIIDPQKRASLIKVDIKRYEKYPVGYCLFIRDVIWDILRDNFREMPSNIPGFFPYQLQLRKIWCMTGIPSFQNAIQAGNHIIDVATDTVDRYKYPVRIGKIEDSGLRNPKDHADICQTIEAYWKVDCYPNIYFPHLAPFFPVIGVSEDGRVGFMCKDMRHVDAKNLVSGDFSSAKRFIFDSQFSHKRLPAEHREALHWIPPIGSELDEHAFYSSEKPTLRSVEKMFRHVRMYAPESLAGIFLNYFHLLRGSALDIY